MKKLILIAITFFVTQTFALSNQCANISSCSAKLILQSQEGRQIEILEEVNSNFISGNGEDKFCRGAFFPNIRLDLKSGPSIILNIGERPLWGVDNQQLNMDVFSDRFQLNHLVTIVNSLDAKEFTAAVSLPGRKQLIVSCKK